MKERLTEELMFLRAIKEVKGCHYVNLGSGLPMRMLSLILEDPDVMMHSENGVLGHGPIEPNEDRWDPECITAGGFPVSLLPGASVFSQVDSFMMMRGGHLDLTFLGAYQVSEKGDMANWMIPGRGLGRIGGAMDLAAGAKRVIVMMKHSDQNGRPRVLKRCTYPITGAGVVDRLITDLAVMDVTPEGLALRETAPGFTVGEIQAVTEANLIASAKPREMEF